MEDLRVIKTKRALGDAFFSIMSEKRFEDMTVNELCERAGVRRATFYKHFKDKYDFLTFIVRSLGRDFDKRVKTLAPPDDTVACCEAYMRTVVDFFSEHRQVVLGFIGGDMQAKLVSLMMRQNYENTVARLEEGAELAMNLPASREAVANMLTGGLSQLILMWLDGGMSSPREQLISDASALIRRIIAG